MSDILSSEVYITNEDKPHIVDYILRIGSLKKTIGVRIEFEQGIIPSKDNRLLLLERYEKIVESIWYP